MKNLYCVQRGLKSFFKTLAIFISKYPKSVIFVSILSSFVLGLGSLKITFEMNFDYLFAPYNCRAYQEREILEKLFPMNRSLHFDYLRMINRGRFGSIIVIPKDGGNVLRNDIFSEIVALDNIVKSVFIKWENTSYNFSTLCAISYGKCYENEMLEYGKGIGNIERNGVFIKYPYSIDFDAMTYNVTAVNLGGVTVDQSDNVIDAKAFRLMYFLDSSDEEKDQLTLLWEKEFLKTMEKQKSDDLILTRFASQTFDQEVWSFAIEALKYLWIICLIIISFCVLTSMTSDWVRSKPLVGFAGWISIALSVISTFGFVVLCGLPCTAVNIIVPFLITGIGVDDSFVLLAAWRRTNPSDNVTKRMMETYSEAAMSVTITSLTNLLSFCVGIASPLPVIRIFCVYAAAAIIFTYIYQITFFGGCMALDGYREEKQLHPITLRAFVPVERASHRGYLYRWLFVKRNPTPETAAPKAMIWCRDTLGGWVSKKWTRFGIIVAFFVYLCVAGFGISTLRYGIKYEDIYPTTSYASVYAFNYNRYFMQYPHSTQVVINTTLDYSDSKVRTQVLNLLHQFEQSPYIKDTEGTTFWLSYYLYFINEPRFSLYRKAYNFSIPEDFIDCLKNVFLRYRIGKLFENDILFSETGQEIIATRFVIVSKNIFESSREKEMLMDIRAIADASKFPVTVQNIWWINFEQYLLQGRVVLETAAMTAGLIIFVFFIFIPNIPNVICIVFSVASIELGVVGLTALWGETLDSISAIVLVISIGLSVDYVAHTSNTYLAVRGKSSEEQIKHALYAVGMPILQSSLSNILSILILPFFPSYILQKFSKIILLFTLITALHGLLILPTLLSSWDIIYHTVCRSKMKETGKNCKAQECTLMTDNGEVNA